MDFLGTCDDLVIMPSEQAVLALAVLYPQPAARGGGEGGGQWQTNTFSAWGPSMLVFGLMTWSLVQYFTAV